MGTIELQIGEIAIDIQCVEDTKPGCLQCCLYSRNDPGCIAMVCMRNDRKDGKDVHFIKVK
jgi:hypothetical protein